MEALAGDAFRRVGSLRLAVDEAELERSRREHDALRERRVRRRVGRRAPAAARPAVPRRDPAPARRRAPARRAGSGGSPRHAAEAGAEIREGDAGRRVDELDADAVVVAGDGFTASLLPELAARSCPTRGQVLATEPLPERRYDAAALRARQGYDYWQQLPDGRLVIGGQRDASLATEQTDVEETTTVRPGSDSRSSSQQLVGLRAARSPTAGRGSGARRRTALPLVGRVPGRDGVWVAGGYSGHGNALGLACGDLVARAILGEQPPELDAVRSRAASF